MLPIIDKYPEHADLIKLGDHCNWAWDCFQLAKAYCGAEDIHGWCGIDPHLVTILREYAFLQVAKIHDPPKSSGHANHSLAFLVERYCGEEKDSLLGAFEAENGKFIEAVCHARKKVIAHSDLAAVQSGGRIGQYDVGADDSYFRSLHDVVTRLHALAGIGPFPEWPTMIHHQTEEFMEVVRRALQSEDAGSHAGL